jgi:chlorite dismutase
MIERNSPVIGPVLPGAARLTVSTGDQWASAPENSMWVLRGVTSYERYVQASEQVRLIERQPPLDRPQATRAALIPIKKSAAWWQLPQDKRRTIFEARSRHIAHGLEYLPAIARRLYHGYDLGEPFDFLTWFEYAPADADAFEELVGVLRQTEEWAYVEREVDLRLARG